LINTHSRLRAGRFVEYLSPEYDAAAIALITEVARHWPADIFVRGLASVVEVLNFPFTIGQHTPGTPAGVTPPSTLYDWQGWALRHLAGLGPVLACLVVLVIGVWDVRAGIGVFLFIIYYCGYPAVQFNVRHFFHLEFVSWWALVFLLAAMCRAASRLIVQRRWPRPTLGGVRRGALTAAIAVLLVVVPATGLRAYQQRHVATLVDGYLRLPRTPLAVSRTAAPGGTLIVPDGLWKDRSAADPVSVQYLVVEFRSNSCGAVNLPLTVKYAAPTSDSDYSFLSRVPIEAGGSTVQVVPAYYGVYSHFTGFVVPSDYENCLTSVSRIGNLQQVPVLVDLSLPPRWRTADLFQTLVKVESGAEPAGTVHVQPDTLVEPIAGGISTVASLTADDIAPGVSVNSTTHSWFTNRPVVASVARQRWVHFPAQTVDAGAVLLARGTLRRGGLRVVTTQDDRGIDSRAVLSPGPFTVLIAAPGAGAFGVSIMDEAAADWRREPSSLLRGALVMVAPWMVTDDFELHDLAWVRIGR
jgi:hypothetical protein